MKRRLFALALALLLAVSLPVSVLAGEWFIDGGDIIINATADGKQTVKQGNNGAVEDAAPVIKQRDSSNSTDKVIKVIAEKDATANVTLDGVNINTDANRRNETAFHTEGKGDVNIELDGSNTLRSGYFSNAAGLNKGNSGTLTINDEDNNGKLEATGGYGGAGIGGGRHSSASDITITGGTITARGSYSGAGIGGGASDINGPYCNGSNITISGGDVTAIGSVYASGIGGGSIGSGSNITISDGKVTAKGGDQGGAGIGGGFWASGSDITISGGEVEATGGDLAAGIGGGNGGNGTDIEISGGKVTAKGGMSGAGIGGGCRGTGSSITISGDAQVKAQGGTEHNEYNEGAGAGIGNGGKQGKNEDGKKVPVDGAEVEPDTSGLTENGRLEYYAPGADMENDAPKKVIENKPEASAPSGASAPVYSVTDKDGNAVSYTAAREGGVLTIRVDAAYARLTLTADEAQALTAQGVEKVVFITTGATSAFRPADLTAYKDEAPFVLTHDGETVTFTAGETDLASLLLQA
jgi:LPXTG-motif cell wall anchor domain protein